MTQAESTDLVPFGLDEVVLAGVVQGKIRNLSDPARRLLVVAEKAPIGLIATFDRPQSEFRRGTVDEVVALVEDIKLLLNPKSRLRKKPRSRPSA
jgi:hypothetical protein